MKVKRLTFKTIPEDLRDTGKWPKVDITALSDEDRARVERLMPAVIAYLQNGKLGAAARSAKLGHDALLDQVNRCLTALEDGGVLGWAGLLPYLRITPYIRAKALPEGAGAGNKGSAGAFQQFLRAHSKIKTALDEAIRKGIGQGAARAAHTSPKDVWGLFVKLAKAAVNDDITKYPLNQKKCAQATVLRYVRHMVATDAKARHTAVGEAALAMCHVGTGKFSFDLVGEDQDLMGIDAHHVDCIGSIEVEGPVNDFRHGAAQSGSAAERRLRLLNLIASAATSIESDRYVIFIDEGQNWSIQEFTWMRDLVNDLHELGVDCIVIVFGHTELNLLRANVISSKRTDLLGRFFLTPRAFRGLADVTELRDTMMAFDDPTRHAFPVGSDVCMSEFFVPFAYDAGWRLGNEAPTLWAAFEFVAARRGRTAGNIGMQWVMASIRTMLFDGTALDRPGFQYDLESWVRAVESSEYESSLQ